MDTLPRTTSHCGTLPFQRGLSSAALYVDSYRVSGDPHYTHRHAGLDRGATRTPSIESIHKDPRWAAPLTLTHLSTPVRLPLGLVMTEDVVKEKRNRVSLDKVKTLLG